MPSGKPQAVLSRVVSIEHPAVRPCTSMPSVNLTDPEAQRALAAFILKLNEWNASALENAPDFAAQGAVIYQANHCGICHMVNEVGMKLGPMINGLGKRQSLVALAEVQ